MEDSLHVCTHGYMQRLPRIMSREQEARSPLRCDLGLGEEVHVAGPLTQATKIIPNLFFRSEFHALGISVGIDEDITTAEYIQTDLCIQE